MKLIGIVGKMGVGKSTAADMLVSQYGFIKKSFSDALKMMLINAGMITKEEAYEKKTDNSRWLMQKVGTEIFRNQVSKSYWIDKLDESIFRYLSLNGLIVVDDVRFMSEADYIRGNGGVLVKIVRDTGVVSDHASEREQDLIVPDMVVTNDGDLDELKQSMALVVEGMK